MMMDTEALAKELSEYLKKRENEFLYYSLSEEADFINKSYLKKIIKEFLEQ